MENRQNSPLLEEMVSNFEKRLSELESYVTEHIVPIENYLDTIKKSGIVFVGDGFSIRKKDNEFAVLVNERGSGVWLTDYKNGSIISIYNSLERKGSAVIGMAPDYRNLPHGFPLALISGPDGTYVQQTPLQNVVKDVKGE